MHKICLSAGRHDTRTYLSTLTKSQTMCSPTYVSVYLK